jgi:nitroimidazol reductase NimA-like FMN-containing flavoprotein (pyridoxamine 5'-phosphate oxidase superfamily)
MTLLSMQISHTSGDGPWTATDLDDPLDRDRLMDGGLESLSESECLAMAARRPIGRVAVSVGALPGVFPVTFCFVGRDVVFRTAAGTKLAAAVRGTIVAFEVDDFDAIGHVGWSVLIVGEASEVSASDVAELEPLPVRAWARGVRDHVVRIRSDVVSGRRLPVRPS